MVFFEPSLSASPQEGSPPLFVDSVEVNLVNVDVWVADTDGSAVPGLRREDFTLFVDGRPMEITHFSAGPAVDDVMAPPRLRAAETPLSVAVVLDLESARPAQRRVVLTELVRFIRRHPLGVTRILVATLGGDVVVRQPFTSDPETLAAEIEKIADIPVGPSGVESEARFVMASLERVSPLSRSLPGRSSGPFAASDRDAGEIEALSLLEQIRALAQREREWARYRLLALARFAGALSGIDGRKALVLAGAGVGNRPGERLLEAWTERFPDLARERNVVPAVEAQALDLNWEVRTLIEHANASFVSFYTVDIGDPSGFAALSAESGGFSGGGQPEVFERLDAQATYLRLAHDTGGLPLAPSGAGKDGLDATLRDQRSAYSLGFEPPADRMGEPTAIEVRVAREGVVVRHRSAIEQRPMPDRMAALTLASLYFGGAPNPLEITVETGGAPRKAESKLFDVPILVKVPLGKVVLLPKQQVHRGMMTVYIGVKDGDGRVAPVSARSFPISVANEGLAGALGQHATFTFTLQMRPGVHAIAVTVRDELASVASTATLNVDPRGRG